MPLNSVQNTFVKTETKFFLRNNSFVAPLKELKMQSVLQNASYPAYWHLEPLKLFCKVKCLTCEISPHLSVFSHNYIFIKMTKYISCFAKVLLLLKRFIWKNGFLMCRQNINHVQREIHTKVSLGQKLNLLKHRTKGRGNNKEHQTTL